MLSNKLGRSASAVLCFVALIAAAPKDIPKMGATPVADAAMQGDGGDRARVVETRRRRERGSR